MSPDRPTIILTVVGNDSVSYTYGEMIKETFCDLTYRKDSSVDYVFQLDEPSIASHWTLTGSRPDPDSSSLQFTAGPGTPCTSYSVNDPGTSDGPLSWSFQYTNSDTGTSFWYGAEESEGSPSIRLVIIGTGYPANPPSSPNPPGGDDE